MFDAAEDPVRVQDCLYYGALATAEWTLSQDVWTEEALVLTEENLSWQSSFVGRHKSIPDSKSPFERRSVSYERNILPCVELLCYKWFHFLSHIEAVSRMWTTRTGYIQTSWERHWWARDLPRSISWTFIWDKSFYWRTSQCWYWWPWYCTDLPLSIVVPLSSEAKMKPGKVLQL